MSDDTLLAQLATLNTDVKRAAHLRASIEGQQAAARQQLEQTDAEIRKLGFDPETAEQDLALLEAALHQRVAAAQVAVAEELAALQAVEQQITQA